MIILQSLKFHKNADLVLKEKCLIIKTAQKHCANHVSAPPPGLFSEYKIRADF